MLRLADFVSSSQKSLQRGLNIVTDQMWMEVILALALLVIPVRPTDFMPLVFYTVLVTLGLYILKQFIVGMSGTTVSGYDPVHLRPRAPGRY